MNHLDGFTYMHFQVFIACVHVFRQNGFLVISLIYVYMFGDVYTLCVCVYKWGELAIYEMLATRFFRGGGGCE